MTLTDVQKQQIRAMLVATEDLAGYINQLEASGEQINLTPDQEAALAVQSGAVEKALTFVKDLLHNLG